MKKKRIYTPDDFAGFLIEHYETQHQVERNGQALGSNYTAPCSIVIFAMIYNFGARFKNKKALEYFNNVGKKNAKA